MNWKTVVAELGQPIGQPGVSAAAVNYLIGSAHKKAKPEKIEPNQNFTHPLRWKFWNSSLKEEKCTSILKGGSQMIYVII